MDVDDGPGRETPGSPAASHVVKAPVFEPDSPATQAARLARSKRAALHSASQEGLPPPV